MAASSGKKLLSWSAGKERKDSDRSMHMDSRFHIASVGKMFTAVLLLQLLEAGRLGPDGLNSRIEDFECLADLVSQMPCLRDSGITLRQMLQHSSGIRDAFSDDGDATSSSLGGKPAPRSLGSFLRDNPPSDVGSGRAWPAWNPDRPGDPEAGVLNWFIWGGGAAGALTHAPGTRFHYSDSAYMIMALLVERLAGRTYEALLSERIFDPLQMRNTFLAYGDAAPLNWRSEVSDFVYAGKFVFSERLDASWDWGGGGQVSTCEDLARFLRGLYAGKLFSSERTLVEMLDFVELAGMPAGCTGLGLGVRRLQSAGGLTMIGHAGAWSVQAFHVPSLDLTITGTFNQPMGLSDFFRHWVLIVADALRDQAEAASANQ